MSIHNIHNRISKATRQARAFNVKAAVRITQVVGSMWCAYAFAALALLGFPGLHATAGQYVQWFSQTFIQLVLLSIIMVGQDVQGRRADQRHHAAEMRMERMEREHGATLQLLPLLHALVADLHAHTHCEGHTTIESAVVQPPRPAPPELPARKRATKKAPQETAA